MKLKTADFPSIFWKWNDRLVPRDIARRVRDLHAWGIRSFLIHPMPDDFRKEDFFGGMTTPYLSPAFFRAVRAAVEQAAELGMEVWIYDEAGWPSGQAGGLILRKWPQLRARVMTPDGLRETTPARADLLHPETTPRFLELTHERYRRAVGEFFGTVIPGVFTDEPTVPGQVGTPRLPWTPDLPEEFARRTGRELEPLLPALFGRGRTPAADQARRAFAEVWTSLFAERFFDPMRRYCHAHGLVLVGHLLGDQSLRGHARCNGDFLKIIGRLDEPGIDTVWGQISPGRRREFFPTFASSALTRPGQRCWSEPFAAYGFGLTVQEMKRVADIQLAQGINKFAPMYVQLSRRAGRWIGTGTRCLDWAPDAAAYPLLDRYLAETGRHIREARLFRPVRVPYPVRDLWARYGRRTSTPFNRLAGELLGRNVGFLFDPQAPAAGVEELTRAFEAAWPFSQRITCSPEIRWIALTGRGGKNRVFCINDGLRTGWITMTPARITWRLAPGESRFLSLDSPEPDPEEKVVRKLTAWEMTPVCQWVLRDGQPEPRPSVRPEWRPVRLGNWSSSLGPWFSGAVCYRTTFHWKRGGGIPWLDLGRVAHAASCRLNGIPLGQAAWAPFRFSLARALRPGSNTLEVEVQGSLANLFTDPKTRKELGKRGWWNVYLQRSAALERRRTVNGLLGPVTLISAGKKVDGENVLTDI
jgi:hypothetical protein